MGIEQLLEQLNSDRIADEGVTMENEAEAQLSRAIAQQIEDLQLNVFLGFNWNGNPESLDVKDVTEQIDAESRMALQAADGSVRRLFRLALLAGAELQRLHPAVAALVWQYAIDTGTHTRLITDAAERIAMGSKRTDEVNEREIAKALATPFIADALRRAEEAEARGA